MTKVDSRDVLKGILAAFDAGLWFGVSIEVTEDHLYLRLDFREVRFGLFETHVSLIT